MATVHSYIRFSTIDQADGDSLRRQMERSIEFCEKHNHTLSDLRFMDLGKSGFRKKNLRDSALKAFLLAIEKGKISKGDILLVEAIDRLSRSGVRATQKLINQIHESGVDIAIIFPQEQVFSHDTKNPLIDAIVLAAYADLAFQYSHRLSDFGKSWWTKQRKEARENGKAIAAVIPWWIIRTDDKFSIDEERAAIIRMIYQYAIDGHGASVICRKLNNKGIHAPRKKTWNKTFVQKVIRERQALGEMQFHEIDDKGKRVPIGEVQEDYYPQIIDEETFNAANAALDNRMIERGPSEKYVNLFQSIVYNVNDNCKANLFTYQRKTKKGKIIERRLKSKDAEYNVPGADTATVDLPFFEKAILWRIKQVDVTSIGNTKSKQSELKAKLHKLTKARKSLEQMQADVLSGDQDYDFLRMPMKELAIEVRDLEVEVRELTAQTTGSIADNTKTILELADKPEHRVELREAIKSVVEKIYIMPIKTGDWRQAPIVCACQIVYRSGDRYSVIFDKAKKQVAMGIDMDHLESTTDEWRNDFLQNWQVFKQLMFTDEPSKVVVSKFGSFSTDSSTVKLVHIGKPKSTS